jgi:hypothetical protein
MRKVPLTLRLPDDEYPLPPEITDTQNESNLPVKTIPELFLAFGAQNQEKLIKMAAAEASGPSRSPPNPKYQADTASRGRNKPRFSGQDLSKSNLIITKLSKIRTFPILNDPN